MMGSAYRQQSGRFSTSGWSIGSQLESTISSKPTAQQLEALFKLAEQDEHFPMKIHDFVHNNLSLMSKERFQIAYDGPIVREGVMDVYDLAPSLVALGDLVKEVNRELNGSNVTATVQVQSNFQRGSF